MTALERSEDNSFAVLIVGHLSGGGEEYSPQTSRPRDTGGKRGAQEAELGQAVAAAATANLKAPPAARLPSPFVLCVSALGFSPIIGIHTFVEDI